MSKQKPVVLILESNEDNIELLEGMLEDEFIVKVIPESGISIESIKEIDPDAFIIHKQNDDVLIDQICSIVKEQNPKAYIVILEDDQTLDKQIYAFECGCDDYLASPFNPIEVHHKVSHGISQRLHSRELIDEANSARDMAYSMLEANSELGSVVRFIEIIMHAKSVSHLGELLLSVGEAFGVDVVVQLRLPSGPMSFNCADNSDISRVLSAAQGRAKIIETGNRLIINGDVVALFIPKMPESDDKKGRLKDNLSILVNTADSRLAALNAEQERNNIQKVLLHKVSDKVITERSHIADHFFAYDEKVQYLVLNFHQQIENLLLSMDLDEKQEEEIIAQIEVFLNAITDTTEIKNHIKSTLDHLMSDLQQINL